MSENANARRTLAKAENALRLCEQYFAKQAETNATAHLADRVLYPPIHGAISSALTGIAAFHGAYPDGDESTELTKVEN